MKQSVRILRNRSKKKLFSWSNLPGKIIYKISKTLGTRNDVLHFKQVCSKWRKRSLTPPQNLLSFNSPLPKTIKASFKTSRVLPFHNSKNPLVLRVSNIYLISPCRVDDNDQSSKPWMVMAEELNPGRIKIRHPLTAKRVKGFPTFLDMTRFEALELVEGYNFKSSNCIHKILLCSSSASSVEVLVLYYKGVLGKFSLDVLGSGADLDDEKESDEDDEVSYSWENLKLRKGGEKLWLLYLDDVARFGDMTCAVDRMGRLYMLDIESMNMAEAIVLVSKPIITIKTSYNRRKRLVVDPTVGELYLVVRENIKVAEKVRFKLYKFNEEGKRWDLVENIGNERVLFVGTDHCFFAMARHFPGCHGNSIVFASNCFTRYDAIDTPDGTLFDDEGVEVGVYNLGEGDNFSLLSLACPEFAEIIWPPPTWFSTRNDCNEEQTEEHATQQSSNEVANSSFVCLPEDHSERHLLSGSSSSDNENVSHMNDDDDVVMLSDSSDKENDADVDDDENENENESESESESGSGSGSGSENENESEEMESNFSGSVDSNANNKNEQSGAQEQPMDEQPVNERPNAQEQPVNERPNVREQLVNELLNAEKQPVNERPNVREQPVNELLNAEKQPVNERPNVREQPVNELLNAEKQPVNERPNVREQPVNELLNAEKQPITGCFALPLVGLEEGTKWSAKKYDHTRQEDVAEEKVFSANRMPVTPSFPSATERSRTVTFQGVEIRSELLPTLETIWAKHGNLIGKNTIRSKKMLGCALEELAELKITLNNTTGRTLTASQADDMRSTLSDIGCAGLKVDWLKPVIERAIALQKSKGILESIEVAKKRKAKIEEDEREYLAQTAKVKQELDESQSILRTRIPFPEDQIIDLDDCLGAGI